MKVEIQVRMIVDVPDEWPRPPQPYIGPFAEALDKLKTELLHWKVDTKFWKGEWSHHVAALVDEVEITAGVLGLETEDDYLTPGSWGYAHETWAEYEQRPGLYIGVVEERDESERS